jgi:hypothetical protein
VEDEVLGARVRLCPAEEMIWSKAFVGHLVSFGFVYPDQRNVIPGWVVEALTRRLAIERSEPANRVCYGTLLSPVRHVGCFFHG